MKGWVKRRTGVLLTRKSREKGTQGPRETQDPRNPVSYFPIHSMHRGGSQGSTLWPHRGTKARKQAILRKALACGEGEWLLPDAEATGP